MSPTPDALPRCTTQPNTQITEIQYEEGMKPYPKGKSRKYKTRFCTFPNLQFSLQRPFTLFWSPLGGRPESCCSYEFAKALVTVVTVAARSGILFNRQGAYEFLAEQMKLHR